MNFKKQFIFPAILLTTLLLYSCKDDEFHPESAILGQWESVTEDLDWTEIYIFNSNNTFLKTRNSTNGQFEASGTFTWTEAERYSSSMARIYLTLTFQTGMEILGSCTTDGIEELIITHQQELRNTWGECDGPILHYKKK